MHILFTKKQFKQDYNQVENYTIGNQTKTYKDYMVEKTPFNDQSTRGFNIKNIVRNIEGTDKNHIFTIINVPGFEPLHSILMLLILEESNTLNKSLNQKEQLFHVRDLKITNVNFYNILKKVLNPNHQDLTGIEFTDNQKDYIKILNQSCYILQNLNMMGSILTYYKEIRDNYVMNTHDNLKKKYLENSEETVKELFNKLFNTQGNEPFITKEKIDDYIGKIGEVTFPEDEKLDFLKPFYKNKSDGKFVCFTDGNPIFEQCLNADNNKFILDLLKNLFFANPTLQKIRYNINVVRPLRHNIEQNTNRGGEPLNELYSKISSFGNKSAEQNGGSEKVMLDNTLIGTLEGFCNIQKSDTNRNPVFK